MFGLISTIVIGVTYFSFATVVFALEGCTRHYNGDTTCVSADKKKVVYCWVNDKTGRTEGCIEITAKTDLLGEALDGATIQNKPVEIFKEALDAAIQESPNATKPPKTDLLQDGGFVDEENKNDTNVPRHLGNPKYGDMELNDPGGLLEEDNGDDNAKPPKDLGGLNEEDLPEPDQ